MNINTAVCPLLLLRTMMMMTVMEIMISFLSIYFFVRWMYFWPVTPKICVNMSMFYIDSSWVGSGLGLYSMQQQCTMSKLSPLSIIIKTTLFIEEGWACGIEGKRNDIFGLAVWQDCIEGLIVFRGMRLTLIVFRGTHALRLTHTITPTLISIKYFAE